MNHTARNATSKGALLQAWALAARQRPLVKRVWCPLSQLIGLGQLGPVLSCKSAELLIQPRMRQVTHFSLAASMGTCPTV